MAMRQANLQANLLASTDQELHVQRRGLLDTRASALAFIHLHIRAGHAVRGKAGQAPPGGAHPHAAGDARARARARVARALVTRRTLTTHQGWPAKTEYVPQRRCGGGRLFVCVATLAYATCVCTGPALRARARPERVVQLRCQSSPCAMAFQHVAQARHKVKRTCASCAPRPASVTNSLWGTVTDTEWSCRSAVAAGVRESRLGLKGCLAV